MRKLTQQEFENKANLIHNNFYSYIKFVYVNSHTKGIVICPRHGEFLIKPNHHLSQRNGCRICSNRPIITLKSFIETSKEIHGDKYDYSQIKEYINAFKKMPIKCIYHDFTFFMSQSKHNGRKQGCPKCNESEGEKRIRIWLQNNNIKYEYNKRFKDCRNKKTLPFDFYLPDYNCCIEFQGKQHFEPSNIKGKIPDLNKQIEAHLKVVFNDDIKKQFCFDKNIILLILDYKKLYGIESILDEYFNFPY